MDTPDFHGASSSQPSPAPDLHQSATPPEGSSTTGPDSASSDSGAAPPAGDAPHAGSAADGRPPTLSQPAPAVPPPTPAPTPAPAAPAQTASQVEAAAAQAAAAEAARVVNNELDAAMAGLDMEAIAASADRADMGRNNNEGDIVEGTILSVAEREILIDLGGKAQGVLPRDEFMPGYEPPIGQKLNVMVADVNTETGEIRLSKKKADTAVLWRDVKLGDVHEGIISGMNKGGLEVAIKGIRGFIPASQVDTHFVKDVSDLFGKTVRVEVIKIERDAENLVVSRRKVLEREAVENREKLLGEIKIGDVRRGKVRNLTDFGAFVDLGGVDGLVHVSDMSWARVEKPADVLKLDDEVDVKVLKINQKNGKISLGLKQMSANPWTTVAERFETGSTIKGRITRHADFGAFVEVEPGVEGLIPISEMSWSRRIRHPKEVCQEGDVVDVAVLSVEPDKQRMSLSLKQVAGDPWAGAAERFPLGGKITGKVLRITDFGAFIELAPGVDAMVHISELSNQRVKTVGDVLKEGQEVEARVIRLDEENRKIGLSMKPDPTPEEIKAVQKAEQENVERKKRLSKPRRGGIDIGWDQGLGSLDPSKFAR